MSEQKAFLEKIHIKNYLSLRNVKLPLKPLTVLVGPNASGKSNVLSALNLFNRMMIAEKLPPVEFIQDHLNARIVKFLENEFLRYRQLAYLAIRIKENEK